jgi:hypothetical protein
MIGIAKLPDQGPGQWSLASVSGRDVVVVMHGIIRTQLAHSQKLLQKLLGLRSCSRWYNVLFYCSPEFA